MKNHVSIFTKVKRVLNIIFGNVLNHKIQINIPKERHGSSYGGWFIDPRNITENSIIYSFGIGEDISFAMSLMKSYGATVHGFDPTPKSINWIKSQKLPETFIMHEFGLYASDGLLKLYPPSNPDHVSYSVTNISKPGIKPIEVPVKKLTSIMDSLKHNHIDILKMDIEGSEYCVIDDLLRYNFNINQILIEFHDRFANIGVNSTKDAIKKLNNHGYQIFSVSNSQEEFSFIKVYDC